MNISAFGKYRVDFHNNYTYISGQEFGEHTYSKDEEGSTKDMEGGELMNFIGNLLIDSEAIDISEVNENTISITMFNSMDGTSNDILIRYEALPDSLPETK